MSDIPDWARDDAPQTAAVPDWAVDEPTEKNVKVKDELGPAGMLKDLGTAASDVASIPGSIWEGIKNAGSALVNDPLGTAARVNPITAPYFAVTDALKIGKTIAADPKKAVRDAAHYVVEHPVQTALTAAFPESGGEITAARGALALPTKGAALAEKYVSPFAVSLPSGTSRADRAVAFDAGLQGGEKQATFKGQMTGQRPLDEPVTLAESAAQKKAIEKNNEYLANKENWAEAGKYLDINPVQGALDNGRAMTQLEPGLVYNSQGDRALNAIQEKISQWRNAIPKANVPDAVADVTPQGGRMFPALTSSPAARIVADALPTTEEGGGVMNRTPTVRIPAENPSVDASLSSWVNNPSPAPHGPIMNGPAPTAPGGGLVGPTPSKAMTIQGFDKLKQAIGEIVFDKNLAPEHTAARQAAMGVYNSIKDEIGKQAPNYAKAMADAQANIEELQQIRGSLSISDKARVETILNKLRSAFREGASPAFDMRKEMVDKLTPYEPTLPYAIAGQKFQHPLPHGLVGRGGLALGLHGLFTGAMSPTFWAHFAASNPRIVGTTYNTLGSATRGARAAGLTQKNIGISADALRLLGQRNSDQQ